MFRNFIKGFFSFFLMIIIILGIAFGIVFISLQPLNETNDERYFTIDYGATKESVVYALVNEGFIKNYDISKLYAKYLYKNDFLAGTYKLKDTMSTLEVFDYLANENNIIYDTVDVRIIEGTFIEEIADRISANTIVTKDELVRYWNNPEAFKSLMEDYPFLTNEALNADVKYLFEGYLFPDTYTFLVSSTPEQITRKMLDRTLVYYDAHKSDFISSKYSIHELFTLASIVQLEAGVPSVMKDIASVFYNRLAVNYRLESSATVCYAIGQKSNSCELASSNDATRNDPYNTYYHSGLTPGPIVSSGDDALNAVLYPSKTNYMFFFASGNTVYFSRTYEEHCAKLGGC